MDNSIYQAVAQESFNWCCQKFGSSRKSGKFPKLIISTDKRYKRIYGGYTGQEIYIYLNTQTSRTSVAKTVIHEFTHFLQFPYVKSLKTYFKIDEESGYEKNPFEIQAHFAEHYYFSSCYRYLKSKKLF